MYCTSLSPCQWKKKKSERDALILNIQSALLCVVCLEFQRRMSLPQCVCVSRQERRRQTRNPFLFLLVKTFHPSICQGEAKGDYYWESKLLACLRVVFRVWWHCPPLSSLTVYFLCVLSIETISPPPTWIRNESHWKKENKEKQQQKVGRRRLRISGVRVALTPHPKNIKNCTEILKHTITFECVENQTRLRKKRKSFLFSLFVKWKYWQRRFWSD